jgi:modification methylase
MRNLLVQADSKTYLPTLIEQGVKFDAIIIDPPYGVKASAEHMQPIARPDGSGTFSGVTEQWDQEHNTRESHLAEIQWQLDMIKQLIKPEGTAMIFGQYHNIHDVGHLLLNRGMFILNDLIFLKKNPVPQMRGVRFCNSIETIIWFRPYGKGKYYFDYHGLKQYNDGKQMRADIHLPVCRGKERLKADDPTKASGKRVLHQTQKPLKLMEILVKAVVPPDGTVLDFYAGVSTTGIAVAQQGKDYVMVEREPLYIEASEKRFADLGLPCTKVVIE